MCLCVCVFLPACVYVLAVRVCMCWLCECVCVRVPVCTCLPVSYGAHEAVVGQVDGLHRAGGLVVGEGDQRGVIHHLKQTASSRVPVGTSKDRISHTLSHTLPHFYTLIKRSLNF